MGFQIVLRDLKVLKSLCEGGVILPVRYLHLDVSQCNKQAAMERRFMNKLMTKGRSKKAAWYTGEQSSIQLPLLAKTVYKHDQRRQVVLNKLFMRNITEMMATGEVASEVVGHGIEISGVKITPDFKIVNVFWVSKDSESVEEVEDILKRSAKMLRHELTQLQLMGLMPRIQFVRDNQYAKVKEVESRLDKADYGEEYIPISSCYRLKPEFTNPEANCNPANPEKVEIEPLFPPMRMDVFGLNHADIMAKIKYSTKKADGHHLSVGEGAVAFPTKDHHRDHQIEFNKEQFSRFIKKRRLAKMKEKSVKNYLPVHELYENEVLSNSAIYEELEEEEEEDYMHEY